MPAPKRPTSITITEVQESREGDLYIWATLDGHTLSFSIHKRGIRSRKLRAGLGEIETVLDDAGNPMAERVVEEGDDLDGIQIFIEQMLDQWEELGFDWRTIAEGAKDSDGRTFQPTQISRLPANHPWRAKHTRRTDLQVNRPVRAKAPERRLPKRKIMDQTGRILKRETGRTWAQMLTDQEARREQRRRELEGGETT